VSTDYQAGDEATSVTVTVNTTCTGEVYNTAAYQQVLEQIVNNAAYTAYGNGYSQAGALQTTIQNVHPTDHRVDLVVQSTGVWVYQFSQSDMQQIKALIAGRTKSEATRLLLQTKGIQSVSITLTEGATLPTDPNRIALSWLTY
jgi:VCBS repeat-containing protein